MTKKDVLTMLRQRGGYISGQELCEQFGVSRAAVWKRIKQLQDEGYEIEAVTNRGYRIVSGPDFVTPEEIESRLETAWAGRQICYLPTVDSTNQTAKHMGEDGAPEGLLVVADEQTGGKGRLGRSWVTPAGQTVAMTLLLRPSLPPDRISMLTLVMGMAVAKACRELYGLAGGIKWPNDVVINGKKISGTLTEMSTQLETINFIVIGTGINTGIPRFPEELREKATSLVLELGHSVSRAELIACVLKRFEQYYESFLQTQDMRLLRAEYEQMLLNKDQRVCVLDPVQAFTGTARGINDRGELLVEREDGSMSSVYAGEVSVRGIYGYV